MARLARSVIHMRPNEPKVQNMMQHILQHHVVRFFVVVVFLRCAWNSKQPVLRCFNWMIPSSYTEN